MGLDIVKYNKPYSVLQSLREQAVKLDKTGATLEDVYNGTPTTFNEFVNHSDCEGAYISYSAHDISMVIYDKETFMLGNLDKLKEEMEIIKSKINEFPEHLRPAMMDFIEDVENENYYLKFS